jgi:TRAP-type C4-dicarboxylate transport system permease small subunit
MVEHTGGSSSLERLGMALERVIYPFSRRISIVSAVAAVVMMLLVTADVVMRRLFNSPIFGAYEVEKLLLLIIVFFGAAYVMSTKGHVFVDTLTRLYPKSIQNVAIPASYFLSLLIMALISWQTTVYGLATLEIGETSVLLRIPTAPFIFIVAFGSAVFFLVLVVQFIYALAGTDEAHGVPPAGFW